MNSGKLGCFSFKIVKKTEQITMGNSEYKLSTTMIVIIIYKFS